MLHIILLVLKIIGIVLLCILGIILLAAACVLFVPVRYRIELDRQEGDGKPPIMVKAKVTWLLHLLNIRMRYPYEKQCLRARIFLFTIFSVPKKEKAKHSTKKKQSAKKTSSEREEKKEAKESDCLDKQTETKSEADAVTLEAPMSGQEQTQKEPEQEEEASEEKLSLMQKLKKILHLVQNFFQKLIEIVQNIQYTIEHFCDKIKTILNNIEYYRDVVESDEFRNSLRLCKDELIRVLKCLRPRKMQADLIIGMDDPAVTGQILAVWGMLYPFIGEYVNIVGDFEQTRIEGHAFIKGKVSIVTFVITVVRIYFNQDVKKLLKLLKKEAA
jgi:molecular chaperone GrpE (heat shock protein)